MFHKKKWVALCVGIMFTVPAFAGTLNDTSSASAALDQLSNMKIKHELLEESLSNIQIQSHIEAVEKKMNANEGMTSNKIPDVSLLICPGNGESECSATLLLPNHARVPAYPGTVIGNGVKIIKVDNLGVLAEQEGHQFYLPFSDGVSALSSSSKSSDNIPIAPPAPVSSGSNYGTPPSPSMPPVGMP